MGKLKKLFQLLKENNISYYLTHKKENFQYITEFKGDEGSLLINVPDKKAYFFTDFRYLEKAEKEIRKDIILVETSKNYLEKLNQFLPKNKTLFFENNISFSLWQKLKNGLNHNRVEPTPSFIEQLRMVKTLDEKEKVKKAAHIADQAFAKTLSLIKENMSELEIAAELEYQMKKLGARKASFDVMVLFGPKSAQPHGVPDFTTRLQPNTPILFDFGAIWNDYCSDMTRMVWFGNNVDEKFKNIFELVKTSQQKAIEALKAGKQGKDIDAVSRNFLAEHNLAQYFGHGLGHGVGREIHEDPYLASTDERELQVGNIVTVEPGVYLKGEFGIRIEDTVYIGENNIEILTQTPKDLIII